MTFCRPGRSFPAVSVTGARCDQMCAHCRGRHLRGMVPAETPEELLRVAGAVASRGGRGLLVSGGCDARGAVPLGRMAGALSSISGGLMLNVHAGFSGPDVIRALAGAGVGRFSVDVHQDPDVISGVLNLDRRPEEYRELLRSVAAAGGRAVPHLTVGFGRRDFEESAELIASEGIREAVLLALVPPPDAGPGLRAPSEGEAVRAAELLVGMGLRVSLGCMRPRSLRGLERRCVEAGVRRIANPSLETARWAASEGYAVEEEGLCCCMTL